MKRVGKEQEGELKHDEIHSKADLREKGSRNEMEFVQYNIETEDVMELIATLFPLGPRPLDEALFPK